MTSSSPAETGFVQIGYSITIGADATQDLWSLMAAATNKLILHGWEISSDAIAATLLEVTLLRLSAVGSAGATVTEVKLDTDDGAITGSVRVGDTTPGTPGDILAGYQWEQLGPLGMIGIIQMFTYQIAKQLDCPIDKPRNLAKSVTVE